MPSLTGQLQQNSPPLKEMGLEERRICPRPSAVGLLLTDSSLKPFYSNSEAIQILTYPENPKLIKSLDPFIPQQIRSALLAPDPLALVLAEFTSGKRRYSCRAFSLQSHLNQASSRTLHALMFEQTPRGAIDFSQLAGQFQLTPREREAVGFLIRGLTSKEIANQMRVSPNTVKAFLRLVMVKMGVSTRSGIVGGFLKSKG
jgi:DNA-binding CsgD family transcriptional regulator